MYTSVGYTCLQNYPYFCPPRGCLSDLGASHFLELVRLFHDGYRKEGKCKRTSGYHTASKGTAACSVYPALLLMPTQVHMYQRKGVCRQDEARSGGCNATMISSQRSDACQRSGIQWAGLHKNRTLVCNKTAGKACCIYIMLAKAQKVCTNNRLVHWREIRDDQ